MKKFLIFITALPVLAVVAFILMPDLKTISQAPLVDGFDELYKESCASCHGDNLEGTGLAPGLLGELKHGDSLQALKNSITNGFPAQGMPAWKDSLDETWLHNMGLYIAERRQGNQMADFKVDRPLTIPETAINTELHTLTLEVIAQGIDRLPYSIALLPDGQILVTEKGLGLSLIDTDGNKKSITGTPTVYNDIERNWGQPMGLGWMLDVALHPDYRNNGWVYLAYTERCEDCNALSRGFNPYEKRFGRPVSMTKLVRGRIKDQQWVDQQIIFEADIDSYSPGFDLSAGGRIAFDKQGYVYLTVGHKGEPDHMGIQDLSLPYGKIHRLHDDGRIPADNPFVATEGAVQSTWTFGHRNPEGLAFNSSNNTLWATEMGPRGGDEINLLLGGENYGWPFYTSGVNYDGSPVDYTDDLGEPIPIAQTRLPVLDITPATAVSSIAFYQGSQFPNWQGNLLLCTLKSSDFLRLEIVDNKIVHQEVLLKDLGRFRDVEVAEDGSIYLLIEHFAGSIILRMRATETEQAAP